MSGSGLTARSAARLGKSNKPIDREAPHFVYRAFDRHGLLLYVGCSNQVERRLAAHRAAGKWYPYLDKLTSEGPYCRDEALRIESEAIDSERPYFNARREHTSMVQANRVAATKLLDSLDLAYEADDEAASLAWYEARDALGVLLRGRFPVVDDEVRAQWYLAEVERVQAGAA